MRITLKTKGISQIIARVKKTEKNIMEAVENVAYELAECFKANFRMLDRTKSKYGHNFYTRYGEARTDYEINKSYTGGTIFVRSYEMAHKLRGGEVRAKNVKYLTIPVSEEARRQKGGVRDATIANLMFAPTRRGGILYTQNNQDDKTVHYVLKKSVVHKPHSYVLPTKDELNASIKKGLSSVKFL